MTNLRPIINSTLAITNHAVSVGGSFLSFKNMPRSASPTESASDIEDKARELCSAISEITANTDAEKEQKSRFMLAAETIHKLIHATRILPVGLWKSVSELGMYLAGQLLKLQNSVSAAQNLQPQA